MSFIYLASPYSHPDPAVKEARFERACLHAADFMESGYKVFCPIAHSHPIEVHGMDGIRSGDFWLEQDFAILRHADKMVVVKMPGWDKSLGIEREIAFCKDNGIPVEFVDG